jgi:DNA-binding cell septation regulator SpoVG
VKLVGEKCEDDVKNIVINEINIVPVRPQNGLVAFASCAVCDAFYVGNIAVYTAFNHPLGYRLVFPTKKLASGKQVACFYPFRKDVEDSVARAIVGKYVDLMGSFHHVE